MVMKRFGFSVQLSNEHITFGDNATGRTESFRSCAPDAAALVLRAVGNDLMEEGYGFTVAADGIPRVYYPLGVERSTANRKVMEVCGRHGFKFNPDSGRCVYQGARLLN
jgi:hypothetical protein